MFYQELGGKHNKEADWLRQLRKDKGNQQQEKIIITKDMVTKQCPRMPKWKASGMDEVQE